MMVKKKTHPRLHEVVFMEVHNASNFKQVITGSKKKKNCDVLEPLIRDLQDPRIEKYDALHLLVRFRSRYQEGGCKDGIPERL
jgi:hypothetical protein